MRNLSVRERDLLPLDGSSTGLTKAEAEMLSRLPLPKGAISWEYQAIRLGPFCGVLRVSNLTIEVLPKIVGASESAERGVLVAMLRKAGHLPSAFHPKTSLEHQRQHLLDVFVMDFCAEANALLRRGMVRTYVNQEADLPVLRGRLQLTEHLRRGTCDRTRLHCRFDELTSDNAHNRALKSVLTLLLTQARSSQTKAVVNVLLRRLEEVSDRPCRAANLDQLHFDRLTAVWEPLFRWGAKLMRGLYPDVGAGRAVDGSCLLFDMQQLFEAFVGQCLRRAWRDRGGHVRLHARQQYLAQGRKGAVFRMIPDVTVVTPDGRVERIMDTKWKALDLAQRNAGVSQEDAYQLAAYASGFDCKNLALLYPRGGNMPEGEVDTFTLRISGEPCVAVYSLDLPALVRGDPLPAGLTTSLKETAVAAA